MNMSSSPTDRAVGGAIKDGLTSFGQIEENCGPTAVPNLIVSRERDERRQI
jgi:hypothetical protein